MEPLFNTEFRNKVRVHAEYQPEALPAMLTVLEYTAKKYEENGLTSYHQDILNCVSYVQEAIKQ